MLCALLLRSVYHLMLRSLEGMYQEHICLQFKALPVPSYTPLCRRDKGLGKKLAKLTKNPIMDITIDSARVKTCGEKE